MEPIETVVKNKITRLPLSNGHYIDVKKRLNAGEEQDLFAEMSPVQLPGERAQLKTKIVQTARVMAYLLTWSLTDDGQPLPMSPLMSEADRLSTLRSLDPLVFNEIRDAINVHEAAVEQEMADRKKAQGGERESSASSPSAAS